MSAQDSSPAQDYPRMKTACNCCPVDIHAHWFPSSWLAELRKRGLDHGLFWEDTASGPRFWHGHLSTGPVGARFTDLQARLEVMREQGVYAQALSLSQPMVYWAGAQDGHALACHYNDCLAQAHSDYPSNFFGLATLPLQDIGLSLQEIDRVATLPGMRGVCIATQVLGMNLSDQRLFPVYERLEAVGLPVFLHPTFVLAPERLEAHYLTNLLGNPFETTVAASHLIFGQVLDRFPRLEFVLPHAGGAFPYLVGRLQRGWEKRKDLGQLSASPLSYLRRFYYDTIGYSNDVLDFLLRTVGADRILMGSDYCFPIALERPVNFVSELPNITAEQEKAILEYNARRLLHLPVAD